MTARRLVVLVCAAVTVFASCGSTDFRSAFPSAPGARAASAASTERAAWIAAAAEGVRDDPDAPAGTSETQITCFGRAVVDGIGVARLKAAGVTVGDLRNPNYRFPARFAASFPRAAVLDLGARLQRCGFGVFITGELMGKNDTTFTLAAAQCIGGKLDEPAQRGFIAHVTLTGEPTDAEALTFARIMLGCVSFGGLIAQQARVDLSASEMACIDRGAHASAAVQALIADEILHRQVDETEATRALGELFVHCLSRAHLRELANSHVSILGTD